MIPIRSSAAAVIAALAALAGPSLVGCDGPPPSTEPPACEPGVATGAATAPDRRLLGEGSAYPGDPMLAARTSELLASQRARRAAAWEVVARVLAPVALADATPVEGATVPRFRTWYDREDFTRIFQHAYQSLTPEERVARARLSESALDEAIAANLRVLDGMSAWTPERWADYLASLHDGLDVANLGGLVRIAISPDAARHVAASYPEILRCLAEGSPSAIVDDPSSAPQRLAREPVSIDRCTSATFGPYYVPTGGRLAASLEGDAAGATLRVHAGIALGASSEERCSAPADAGCEVEGPGAFVIEVIADRYRLDTTLDVTSTSPDAALAGCLDGPFPLASATVAQEWRRVELGPLPTYDTSADALAAMLAAPEASWTATGTADPGPDAIYTQRVDAGGTFRLAGMHIRTRELDHWMNITLWWSPTPDETFGADRPESIRALGGPWSHYAMCVAIEDIEQDPDPTGGFAEDAPSLAAALAAVHDGRASWCSNPYIDAAPGLARSNCVGCHQHAMSGLRPGETVMDELRFPESGRLFVRDNFPADQFWGLDAGDDLAVVISDTVAYWDTATTP